MLCQCTAFAMRFVLSLSDCSTISATRFIESPMDTVSIAIPETFMDSESLLLTPFQSSMIALRRSDSGVLLIPPPSLRNEPQTSTFALDRDNSSLICYTRPTLTYSADTPHPHRTTHG